MLKEMGFIVALSNEGHFIEFSKKELEQYDKILIKQAKQEVKDKNSVFVNHVHNHFKKEHPNWKVICKICGKDIDEIYEQEKKQSEKKRSS